MNILLPANKGKLIKGVYHVDHAIFEEEFLKLGGSFSKVSLIISC